MIKLSCLTLEFTCHAIKLFISKEHLSQIFVSRQWPPYLFTLLAVGPCGAKLNRNYLIASITRFLSLLQTETADVRGFVSKADSVYSTKCNPIADYTMVTIEILISHAVGVHYVGSKLVSPEKLIS